MSARRFKGGVMTAQPKYTLEDLWKRVKFVAAKEHLRTIALEASSPSAAFDAAEEAGEKEHACRDVRYLAMVKRDYGMDAFNDICRRAAERARERQKNYRPSDEGVWTLDYIKTDLAQIEDVLNDLADLSPADLREAFDRSPVEALIPALIKRLADIKSKLQGLYAYADQA
jgi:hypothetical protein